MKSTPKKAFNYKKYNLTNLDITPTSTKINPKYFLASKLFPQSPAFDSSEVRMFPHKRAKTMRKSQSAVEVKYSTQDQQME